MEEGVGEDDSSAAIGFCATSKHVKERRAVEVVRVYSKDVEIRNDSLTYSTDELVRGAWCCLRNGWTDDAAGMLEAIPVSDWERQDVRRVARAWLVLSPVDAKWAD